MNPVQTVGYVVFVAAVLGGFVCGFIVVVNMFRTVANRKPDVPLFPNWWESPFNILFRPSQLTDRGLSARRCCVDGSLGFLVCLVVAAFIAVTTGIAD
jgi:hypothetical protein